jgi:hypothetical protein
MEDRISQILKAHLHATELQLAAAEHGIEISAGVIFLRVNKEGLLERVATLRAAIESHEVRMAQGGQSGNESR